MALNCAKAYFPLKWSDKITSDNWKVKELMRCKKEYLQELSLLADKVHEQRKQGIAN